MQEVGTGECETHSFHFRSATSTASRVFQWEPCWVAFDSKSGATS